MNDEKVVMSEDVEHSRITFLKNMQENTRNFFFKAIEGAKFKKMWIFSKIGALFTWRASSKKNQNKIRFWFSRRQMLNWL